MPMKKQTVSVTLFTVGFLLVAYFNQLLLGGYRLDLTENQLYTLSKGSHQVIDAVDEPIEFYFFFSDSASRELTTLRGYADQVEALLKEYERASAGKIKLYVVDPEPFSEEEDQAAAFGLTSVPINNAGDELYFGLAAKNSFDQEVIIPFFQPDKEKFLEYDLSRTIQTLSEPELPRIALLSGLEIQGSVNMQTFQTTPPWMMIEQLQQRYELELLDAEALEVPSGVDLLVLVHPKQLSNNALYAIDQFAMGGGRLLIFVDPFAEMDPASGGAPLAAAQGANSDLESLFNHWGVELIPESIIADADLGLSVGSASGLPVRHIGMLGLGSEQLDAEDIAVSAVSSLNVSSAGILRTNEPPAGLQVQSLVSVGPYAAPMPVLRMQMMSDPEELLQDFNPDGETHDLVLRLSGVMSSAFSESSLAGDEHISQSDNFNAVIISDTDILSDRLWVQVQNFFGQRIASPFAGNGDLVFNLVDNLAGSSALISIRGRGQYARPFDVVQDLRREAEAKYLSSAEELQAELLATETRLAELSAAEGDNELVTLSTEQEAELVRFQEDKLRIRKQLRDVRHQLDKDIDGLGATLKFLNILFLPILLTLALMMINYIRLSNR